MIDRRMLAPLLLPGLFSPESRDALLSAAAHIGYAPPPSHADPAWALLRPDAEFYDRDNARALLDDPDAAATLCRALRPHLPALPGWTLHGVNPRLRLYRYRPGGYMAPHRDGSYQPAPGLQSLLTLLVYLSDACEGGETILHTDPPQAIPPRAGDALIFPHDLLHAGAPVRRGEKIVLRTDILFESA